MHSKLMGLPKDIKRIKTRLCIEYYLWQFHSSLKRTVIYNWAEHSHWKHWSIFLSVMANGTTTENNKGKVLSSFKMKVLDLLLPCFYIHNVVWLKLSMMSHECPSSPMYQDYLFSKRSLNNLMTNLTCQNMIPCVLYQSAEEKNVPYQSLHFGKGILCQATSDSWFKVVKQQPSYNLEKSSQLATRYKLLIKSSSLKEKQKITLCSWLNNFLMRIHLLLECCC